MVISNMNGCRTCSKCQGLMVLEDQGEFLEVLDVMSLFEYRCLACGRLERSGTGALHVETKESARTKATTLHALPAVVT